MWNVLILASLAMTVFLAILTVRINNLNPVRYRRLRFPMRTFHFLLAAVKTDTQASQAVRASAKLLSMQLIQFKKQLLNTPRVPCYKQNESRLLPIARQVIESNAFSAAALLSHIDRSISDPTASELVSFPLYVGLVNCHRLIHVLHGIMRIDREEKTAASLSRRLTRMKHPIREIEKADLHSAGISKLLSLLHESGESSLFSTIDQWLLNHGSSAEQITIQASERQIDLINQLRLTENAFQSLERLNWLDHCESSDILHQIFLDDPSGAYPHMTVSSRAHLRLAAEKAGQHFHLPADKVARLAQMLSHDSSNDAPERYIGFWFQRASGLLRLHRELKARHGLIYSLCSLRRRQLQRITSMILTAFLSILFLNMHQPVFLLPFFMLITGFLFRSLIPEAKDILPSMDVAHKAEHIRTLIIFPCLLSSPQDAIAAVRRIKTLRRTFNESEADLLLLGDFPPNMTAVSSSDAAIIHAASSALHALNDERCQYLQRGRTWDDRHHTYMARGGKSAAAAEICRLIAQGECSDVIAYATFEAAKLERRYAYVLVLDPQQEPVPGLLEHLLSRILHPNLERYPLPGTWHGCSIISWTDTPLFTGTGLIRPASYLEAVDGFVNPDDENNAVCGELAGFQSLRDNRTPVSLHDVPLKALSAHAKTAWTQLKWQLPWVRTPAGIQQNPLQRNSRLRLRIRLYNLLVPSARCILLLWSVLQNNWILFLLSVFTPDLITSRHDINTLLLWLCRLSLTPARAAVVFRAFFELVRPYSNTQPDIDSQSVWVQGIASAVFVTLAFVLPHMQILALLTGILFGCYIPAIRFLECPAITMQNPGDAHISMLAEISTRTWRYFNEYITETNHFLPPDAVQLEPHLGPEMTTSPEAIGAYLFSCVCAKELRLISADAAAHRLSQTHQGICSLPLPLGLLAKRYTLPDLSIADDTIESSSTGFLLVAILSAAQALRAWLPELSSQYELLSSEYTRLADSFDIAKLYDASAGLFFHHLNSDAQGEQHAEFFHDATLLLSVAAFSRGIIPPSHFSRLKHFCVHIDRFDIPLSDTGEAINYLLSGLFFPEQNPSANACIEIMQRRSCNGLWGLGNCRGYDFTPSMRYHFRTIGIPEAALSHVFTDQVFAPYTAALCLQHRPLDACELLLRYRDCGMLTPLGFYESIDMTNMPSIVGLYDTFHQGLILMSAANYLAAVPLHRYFGELPEVEACLPLLRQPGQVSLLPSLPVCRIVSSAAGALDHTADPLSEPPENYIHGTEKFRILTNAWGHTEIYDADLPLIARDTPEKPSGIHFYLFDEDSIYHLNDPRLAGHTKSSQGQIFSERNCGSIRTELISIADTVSRRAIHILTITNLSTLDRILEIADCLIPDLGTNPCMLEPHRFEHNHLLLHDRETDRELHHTLCVSVPPLSVCICTDANEFLGRNGTFHDPALLQKPMQDHFIPSAAPCLSFRVKLTLGSRGQVVLWFSTALNDTPAPMLDELPGICRLAAMQQSAIEAAAPLDTASCQVFHLLMRFISKSDFRIMLIQQDADTSALRMLADITSRLYFHGCRPTLYVACMADQHAQLSALIQGHPAEHAIVLDDIPPGINAIILSSEHPLLEQLSLRCHQLAQPVHAFRRPSPALLPEHNLKHTSSFGGFDAETGAYVIELAPGTSLPVPWINRHRAHFNTETVDDSGFRLPFHEKVWILTHDNVLISPWHLHLPRSIHMEAGMTIWDTWSERMDIRLCATCIPRSRHFFRVLRLRNVTEVSITVRIIVQAELPLSASGSLETVNIFVCSAVDQDIAFLAGNEWHARRIRRHPLLDEDVPLLNDVDDPNGTTALLELELSLPPHSSSEAFWITGYTRSADAIIRTLNHVCSYGTSSILHAVRREWAGKLRMLTVSTPEDTFNTLMNTILPVQNLQSHDVHHVYGLALIDPTLAKRALLQALKLPMDETAWAEYICSLACYIRITGDQNILDTYLAHQDASLFDICCSTLLSLSLERNGLPHGDPSGHQSMLFALAAKILDEIRPTPALREFCRKLLNAADTLLWKDGCYGAPLQLKVQALACAAYGSNPRTRQAVRTAWTTLYDQNHGLIRIQEPSSSAGMLPGLPENGGMVTRDAAIFLHALIHTGFTDQAHELMRALNPIHHTDTSARMAAFQQAPYRLHGGMNAYPMEPGRAIQDDGSGAASILYTVLLQDVLGLHREGQQITLHPCVPSDWEVYSLTLAYGASTWHINAERNLRTTLIDGEETDSSHFTLIDDGRVHQIRIPII